MLKQIRRHLLPTPAVSPPIPSDHELLIQRLLGTVHPVQPVVQERSRLTDIEILLQSILPGRIGGRGRYAAAGASSGADGWVFFVRRVGPCDCMVPCSG